MRTNQTVMKASKQFYRWACKRGPTHRAEARRRFWLMLWYRAVDFLGFIKLGSARRWEKKGGGSL